MSDIKPLDPDQYHTTDAQAEVIQLKEHIASGADSIWTVLTDNRSYGPFASYDNAKAQFDALPVSLHPHLMLYTRIGTAVSFHYKGDEDDQAQI